jgi:hypothetical protein
MRVPPSGRLLFLCLASAVVIGGCSLVPNLDAGSAGCSNAVGIGQPNVDAPVGDLVGLSPAQAATIAAGRGHTVVFNVQIEGYGECWCAPPPEGTVTQGFFTGRGALMLMIDGVDEGHTADNQPFTGWGC